MVLLAWLAFAMTERAAASGDLHSLCTDLMIATAHAFTPSTQDTLHEIMLGLNGEPDLTELAGMLAAARRVPVPLCPYPPDRPRRRP
jgi:hypothetical protein